MISEVRTDGDLTAQHTSCGVFSGPRNYFWISVFKGTHTLEVEAHVPPLDLYLDGWLAAFQNRLANSEVGQLIQKACSTIQTRIRNRRGRKRA
jgi:hypothetical protein